MLDFIVDIRNKMVSKNRYIFCFLWGLLFGVGELILFKYIIKY